MTFAFLLILLVVKGQIVRRKKKRSTLDERAEHDVTIAKPLLSGIRQ